MTTRHEEAAQWFAASRRGMMSVEERGTFDGWIRLPANAAAFRQMEETWAALGTSQAHPRKPSVLEHRQPVRTALLAAACVASLGIGVLSYGGENSPFWTKLDWEAR